MLLDPGSPGPTTPGEPAPPVPLLPALAGAGEPAPPAPLLAGPSAPGDPAPPVPLLPAPAGPGKPVPLLPAPAGPVASAPPVLLLPAPTAPGEFAPPVPLLPAPNPAGAPLPPPPLPGPNIQPGVSLFPIAESPGSSRSAMLPSENVGNVSCSSGASSSGVLFLLSGVATSARRLGFNWPVIGMSSRYGSGFFSTGAPPFGIDARESNRNPVRAPDVGTSGRFAPVTVDEFVPEMWMKTSISKVSNTAATVVVIRAVRWKRGVALCRRG